MSNNFDVADIFKEILTVLNKHAVPAQTIALDISLLPKEYDEFCSSDEMRLYKAGVFYKSIQIENNSISATLRIRRRFPFDDIVIWLEQHILPIMQKRSNELECEFKEIRINVHANRTDDSPDSTVKHYYGISIQCANKDAHKPEYGDAMLAIDLRQFDATSYPVIDAFVGTLVDEESGGDWGIHRVVNLFSDRQEVNEYILEMLEASLPHLYESLRETLRQSGF